MITLSIITVCWNNLEELKKTCESVQSQNQTHIEHVVIDGNSSDGTQNYLKEYQEASAYQVNYISEPDNGIYNAMNKGTKICQGLFLHFLNAGDIFYNNKTILEVMPNLKANFDIVYGLTVCKLGDITYNKGKVLTRDSFFFDMPSCHQSIFFNNSKKNVHYDESFKLCADYALLAEKFMANECFHFLKFPIVYFDLTGVSSQRPKQLHQEKMQITLKHFGLKARLFSLLKPFYFLKYKLVAMLKKTPLYSKLLPIIRS